MKRLFQLEKVFGALLLYGKPKCIKNFIKRSIT
jgi:hypothetical protein